MLIGCGIGILDEGVKDSAVDKRVRCNRSDERFCRRAIGGWNRSADTKSKGSEVRWKFIFVRFLCGL